MFDELVYFDESIERRYKTVEGTIKGKSNSFYDSFLDLLENTIKRILILENAEYDDKLTCGTLLRKAEIAELFKSTIGVDEYVFAKCQDYIAKINKHKHFNEHQINIESVVTYMRIYHGLVAAYLNYKGESCSEFDADYYYSIYGLTERRHKELQEEVEQLKGELEILLQENRLSAKDAEMLKELIKVQQASRLSLEEQNDELNRQLNQLKDIKINSIEAKLNKALELLYSLTDSVVESRAIGIAVGKTIIGKDVTETDYMKDAMESVKKRDSVFEMLSQQGKEIGDLSDKFSDMRIDSLYKSAKENWDAENFKVAGQFYEHICLLRPLDWKAPFYAGLCQNKGNYTIFDFIFGVFPRMRQVFYATIDRIKNIENEAEKLQAANEVFEVSINYGNRTMDNYVNAIKKPIEESKYSRFEEGMSFIFDIQAFIAKLLRELEGFRGMSGFHTIASSLAKIFERSIKEAEKKHCSKSITSDEFYRFLGYGGVADLPYLPASDH